MVSKRFCDYCRTEIKNGDLTTMEFLGEEKDICKECTEKIINFLRGITNGPLE